MAFSKYFEDLSADLKPRYRQKIRLCDGLDPYSLSKTDFSNEKRWPSVEYPDIVNYLVLTTNSLTNQQMKAYKSLEAYNYFVSGWIQAVSCKTLSEERVLLVARVNHSQRMSATALSAWILVKQDGEVITAHCNCMAGLGESCSHVGAVLFYLEAAARLNGPGACTEEKNKWIMPSSMKKVPYLPVKEINFSSAKRQKLNLQGEAIFSPLSDVRRSRSAQAAKIEPTPQEIKDFYEAISKCGTKPAILSLIPEYCEEYIPKERSGLFPTPLTSLFDEKNLKLSMEELLELSRGVTLSLTDEMIAAVQRETIRQSGSKLWYRQRAGRITASQLRAACHSNPMNPSKSLVKKICYPESHNFSTKATTWGIQHEKVARLKYEEFMANDHTNFAVVDTGLHLNPQWPFLGASPDGLVQCSCCGLGVCEIKCPFSAKDQTIAEAVKAPNCCLASDGNSGYKLSRDHPYYYQVQAQLHISGRDYCDFVLWTSKDWYMERIQPDFEMWELVAEQAEFFFHNAVLPELLGRVFSRSAVKDRQTPAETDLDRPNPCLCGKKLRSKVVTCASPDCHVKTFHIKCVNLRTTPKNEWFCDQCENKEN